MKKIAEFITIGVVLLVFATLCFWLYSIESIFFPLVIFVSTAYLISAILYNVIDAHINRGDGK